MKAKDVTPFMSKMSREQSTGRRDGKTRNEGGDIRENRKSRISFKSYLRNIEEEMLEDELMADLDAITDDLEEESDDIN